MADPISVLSAAGVLLDSTTGVLKAINELAREFHHAPTDIASLARSLQSLMDVLDNVVHENIRAIADNGRKHPPSFQALIAISA